MKMSVSKITVAPSAQFLYLGFDGTRVRTLRKIWRRLTPRRDPPIERPGRFARTPAGQKTGDADVFVKVGPVDADTTTDQSPVAALGGSSLLEAWEPDEGNRDGASVGQRNH
jgi:hypothetical protein